MRRTAGRARAGLLLGAVAIALIAGAVASFRWFLATPQIERSSGHTDDGSPQTDAHSTAESPPPRPAPPNGTPPSDVVAPRREADRGWSHGFGRVVDEAGAAIEGATIGTPKEVELEGRTDEPGWDLAESPSITTTDAEGRFTIEAARPEVVLVASAPGFGAALLERSWLGAVASKPLEVMLARSGALLASILDTTDRPVDGVTVRAFTIAPLTVRSEGHELDLLNERVALQQSTTDRDGHATLALPAHVPFRIELWHRGALRQRERDAQPIELEPGGELRREWRLELGTTVNGMLLDEAGRPVGAATIEVAHLMLIGSDPVPGPQRSSVQADASGHFTIPALEKGLYLLKVDQVASTPERDGSLLAAKEFEVPDGADSVSVDLRVRRGWSVHGTVLDPDGKRTRAKIQVTSVESGKLPFLSRESDESGRFALGPFESESAYELVAVALDGRFAPSESVPVDPRRHEPVLRLRAGASLGLTAIRASDSTRVAATFELVETSNSGIANAPPALTSTDGTFRSVPPGHYDVIVTTDDGWIGFLRDVSVRVGAALDEKTVTLNRGATLKIRHRGPPTERCSARLWLGAWCFRTSAVEAGRTTELLVPARSIRMELIADSGTLDETLELEPGETRELDWPRAR